ncbi:MAG: DUF2490 domain-containing protein [Luteibaculaceae bacterium]
MVKRIFASTLLCIVLLLSNYSNLVAQTNIPERNVTHQNQQWVGYMTATKINDKWSIWNDFHYVPGAFFVARPGISRHFYKNLILTGGYAYLNLPVTSLETNLNRTEHRPWAQLVANHKVSDKIYMTNRIRYDARFRQNFAEGALLDDFSFNHRMRMLISMRFPLIGNEIKGGTPFINVSNEILVNFGENVVFNHFDQNRIWVTFGWQIENLTLQTGYMNRFVQLASGNNFVTNHTILFWVTQSFDLRKKKERPEKQDEGIFYRQP